MPAIPDGAALIIVDLQKAIDHPSWGERNNPDAEAVVRRLLLHWRARGRPIVHVRHVSRFADSSYRDGQEGVEFKAEVQPLEGERVVTKHVPCAFIGTDLEAWLRGRGISSVVITGVITNNSVEATARVAGDLGFQTFVVADGTFTFGRKDYSGRWRTAEEVHDLSLANLDEQYATIVRSADLLSPPSA